MAIIHIYGASAIFLLFCDNQDTGSDSEEMEIGVSVPILSQKKIKRLFGTKIPILHNMGENIVAILYIYCDRAISLLFWDH